MLAIVLVGVAGLVLEEASRSTTLVQTLGVQPIWPVAPIVNGEEACQTPIGIADPLRRVRFNVGTLGRPGPPLTVSVYSAADRTLLGQGEVRGGWVDNGAPQIVAVGDVRPDQLVSVCVRNTGRVRAYVYGDFYSGNIRTSITGVRPTITTSHLEIDGQGVDGDLSMIFVTKHPVSRLSRIPAAFRHASQFRPGFVAPWVYWLLVALLVVGAPLALWRALRSALAASAEARPPLRRAPTPQPTDGVSRNGQREEQPVGERQPAR